jgi:hypothetical protein
VENVVRDIGRTEGRYRREIESHLTAIYESAGANLLLFQSETVHDLSSFYHQIYYLRGQVRNFEPPEDPSDLSTEGSLGSLAVLAAQAVPEVAKRLDAEGRIRPESSVRVDDPSTALLDRTLCGPYIMPPPAFKDNK